MIIASSTVLTLVIRRPVADRWSVRAASRSPADPRRGVVQEELIGEVLGEHGAGEAGVADEE